MQNLNSFISSLCSVLIDHLSCGWNVRLSTGKVTTVIYYLQVYSPTLWLSCGWCELTLVSHFALPYCRFKITPKNRKPAALFLLRQCQGVQDNEPCCSHLPTAAQTPADSLFAFPQFPVLLLPLWMWECATQEFLPLYWGLFEGFECYKSVLMEMADPSWQLWWLSPLPCHVTRWLLLLSNFLSSRLKLSQALKMPEMFLSPFSSQMKTPWISLLVCCAQGLKMPRTLPVECVS